MKVHTKLIKTFGALLIAALLFAALPAGTAKAQTTITVCPGGTCNYTTIQAAIDVAQEGNTIQVAAGTYIENPATTTAMNKSIKLIGETDGSGNPLTILEGTLSLDNSLMTESNLIENIKFQQVGATDSLVLTQINGITIKNCEFVGSDNGVVEGRAIQINGGSNGTDDVVVDNCLFRDGYYIGIQGAVKDITVKDSEFVNLKSGLNMTSGETNLVVDNTAFSVVAQGADNDTYGIRLGSSTLGSSKQLTITNSSFVVDKNGFVASSGTYHAAIIVRAGVDGTTSTIQNSSILGDVVNLSTYVTLDATSNWWGSAAGPTGQISGDVDYVPWCADAACTELTAPVYNETQLTYYETIQDAVAAAVTDDVIEVRGTYILGSVVNLDKAITLTCADDAKIQVSGTGDRFDISAAASIIGCEIEKTDEVGEQNIIRLRANGITIKNNTIWGYWDKDDPYYVSRAMIFNAGGYSGYLIDGNEIYNLRQPAYISGTHTGTISNNYVHGTKGWVLEGGNLTFTNNTWGSGANANVIDIAILSLVGSSYYTDVPAMSAANNNAVIEDQRTSPATLNPVYVDASAPACTADCGTAERPYQTIQAGIDRVVPGGTVYVAAGTYAENIVIEKSLNLIGPNAGVNPNTVSRSPEALIVHETGLTTAKDLVTVESDGVLIDGFMLDGKDLDQTLWSEGIYSKGNNLTVKNNIIKNFPYMAIRSAGKSGGPFYSGILIENNKITMEVDLGFTGYNFGIYVQGSTGTVKGNVVDKVESGIQVQPYKAPGPGLVENNYFSAYKLPLYFNYTEAADASWEFNSNTVTGEPYPVYDADNWYQALRVETFYDGAVSFTNNTVNIGDSNAPGIWMLRLRNITNGDIDLEATLDNNTWEKVVVVRDGTTGEIKTDYFYSSIQDAIDAASDGDTIEVGPGTYAEYVELRTPNITVRSTAGAAETELVTPSGTLTTGVKVLANMGTVTFDGFTVKNFTESGIIQPMSARTGTTFHVLNNVVIPFADYLRNGIQVSGDGSTVIGNTVYGKRLTDDWGSTGITVVDGSNISVLNNTIIGGATGVDYGIGIIAFNNDMSNITIEGNTITDAGVGVGPQGNYWGTYYSISDLSILSNIITDSEEGVGAYWFEDLTNLVVERNQFNNLLYGGLWIDDSLTGTVSGVDASPNWWGSIDGPDQLSADVDVYIQGDTVDPAVYTPWCGDAACSFLLPEVELEGKITDTITIDTPGMIYFLKDGTVIDPGTGPCFDIKASNVTIYTESPGGAVCYPGSPGIQVIAGAKNIVINGLEIDGQDTAVGHGIHFLGSIEDLYLSDNFIHNMVGDGVHFAAVPTGRVEIKGNLFMGNTGLGINNAIAAAEADTIDATYNAWGDYDGPNGPDGDDVSDYVTFDPWTHVDVFAEYQADSSRYAEEVAVGEQITYAVKADLQNAIGAHFTLTFDTDKLAVVSASTDGTVFPFPFDVSDYPEGTVVLTEGVTVLGNKITFDGARISAISGKGQLLFTVTFEGLEATDTTTALSFEAADDAQFAMNPGVGPSLNIFPVALVGEDVNVYDLPTLAIYPLDDFAAGNPKEFTLTVTNLLTGRAYTTLNVELDVPLGTTLEYFDGTNWVTYLDGVEIGPLAIDATADVLFRVAFSVTGDPVNVTVDLYDDAIFLVENTFGFSVAPVFTVTASVSMQGRSVFNGVLVTLSEGEKFGPYTATSVNLIKNNVTFENVGEGGYTLTISQDRYLDLILANGKSVSATADVVLTHIELRGGDLNNSNDVGLGDASIVGRDYGKIGNNQGDANFDNRVNIYDLAMVGGNYGLTSEAAYGTP